MASGKFIRGALAVVVGVVGLAVSGGGVHHVSAGSFTLSPGVATQVAVPSVTVVNEKVIAAERSAGLCHNGFCPLTGCSVPGGVLTCGGVATTCHVSVGGTCLPPSSATVQNTSTSNSPSCFASSCNFHDPNDDGCSDDAVTNNEIYIGGDADRGSVYSDNRWSNACKANWTRTFDQGGDNDPNLTLYAYTDYEDHSNYVHQYGGGNYLWSLMLDGSGSLKVCSTGATNYNPASSSFNVGCY